MRIAGSFAALSIALVANACGKAEQPVVAHQASPDSSHAAALVAAPQTYQRMRFVSPTEQSTYARTLASTARRTPTHRAMQHVAPAAHAQDPLVNLEASIPAAAVTSVSSAAPAAAITVALKAAPEMPGTPAPWSSEGLIDRRPGAVVIRGGLAQPEKCDPLTDAKARRASMDRGSFRMPQQGGSVLSRGGMK